MDIENSIDTLHERTQQSKLEFSRHEAVCQERYEQLIKTMDEMATCMKDMRKEINELRTIATTGRVSLKTLLWVGSMSGAVIGIVLAIGNYFK